MTATDELRRLLDERGVECEDMSALGYLATLWHGEDAACTALEGADDIPHGKVSVQACLTPAQAIDATLGRGTCEIEYVSDWMGWHCKACDMLWQGLRDQRPRYCPSCGRRVEP